MWTKSPDTDLTDRRLLEAGPLGHHLYHRAQLFMAANLTSGHISRRALRSLDDFAGIAEDGAPVTLDVLAARLVQVELWRIDGEGYYDLRYEGLNPADLIEKRREAGKASAAARAAKFGTANPRANREHREHIPEHEGREHREQTPEQKVNRPRPRTRITDDRTVQTKRPTITDSERAGVMVSVTAGMTDEELDRLADNYGLEDLLDDEAEIENAALAEFVDDETVPDDEADCVTAPPTLSVGDRVHHERYRDGTVREVHPDKPLVQVAFDRGPFDRGSFDRPVIRWVDTASLSGTAVAV